MGYSTYGISLFQINLGNDQMRVILTILRVQSVHYQEHVLRVVNSVGSAEERFRVVEGEVEVVAEPFSSSNVALPSVCVLSLLVIFNFL